MNITQNLLIRWLLIPVSKTATFNSLILDRASGESAAFIVSSGASTGTAIDADNKMTVTMQESDTTADGDFTTVGAGDQLNTMTTIAASAVYRPEYIGNKQYVRLRIVWTGTPALILGINGYIGSLRSAPAGVAAVGTSST